MEPLSTRHQQIRLKITAFLFNRRADALREEIYRALCLHILSEMEQPCSHEEIVELVGSVLGKKIKVSDSLRAIIFEALRTLTEDKIISCKSEQYFLPKDQTGQLPDPVGQKQFDKTITQELRKIAISLNPNISKMQLDLLFDFYIKVSNVIVSYQLRFLSKGLKIQDIDQDLDEISVALSEYRKSSDLDKFIDIDAFISKSLIHPNEELSNYLYRLIQVGIITQLLAWDPELEYLHNTILSGRTLYLDSSVLFIITQKSHPLHYFLSSLLKASHDELGVQLKIHDITLKEYDKVMIATDRQFPGYLSDLKTIAKICIRDNETPMGFLENSIFADYLSRNLYQVDLGTWQKYFASVTQGRLIDTLRSLSVEVDKRSTYVPPQEFEQLKEAMAEASKIQVKKGKRSSEKTDLEHDVKLYNYISNILRKKRLTGQFSLGYDTYLLTFDGSLVYFTRKYRIPYSETYFIYPGQWYQLTFPFLRLKTSENPGFTEGLTSLIFSPVSPSLTNLIPLDLCTYIFNHGGTNLPMGSIQNLIQALMEERLIDSLDPNFEDKQKREEAALRVERMIKEEALRENKTLKKLQREVETLKGEQRSLEESVGHLAASKENLGRQVTDKETELLKRQADLGQYGAVDTKVEAVKGEYEEQMAHLKAEYTAEIKKLQEESERRIKNSGAEIAKQSEEYKELQSRVDDLKKTIEQNYQEEQEERERQKIERAKRMLNLKKSVVTVLMFAGLIASLILLIQFEVGVLIISLSIVLIVFGLVFYHWRIRNSIIPSFIAYGLGLIITTGVILEKNKSETLLWIIPMGWEVLVIAIDRIIGKQTTE